MKKYILVLVFYIVAFKGNIYSQDYIPMLTDDAVWTFGIFWGGSPNPPDIYTISYSGNTIILGSHTYKDYSGYYVREDVAAKKVYRYFSTGSSIGEELLFDFSLNDGDVMPSTGWVMHITNVNLNGIIRRKFEYYSGSQPLGGWHRPYYEGVGGTLHPFLFYYQFPSGGPASFTNCSYQNDVMIYNRGLVDNGVASDCNLSLATNSDTFISHNITVTPIPFKYEFTISSNFYLENVILNIYDSLGKKVEEINNLNGQKITLNRGNLNSGIYFIKLFQDGNLILTDKIIVE